MSITPVGHLILPLGLLLFAKGLRPLFWAFVVSIPFFDVYVVHVTSINSVVRPNTYLGALMLLRYFLDSCLLRRLTIRWTEEFKWLLVFLLSAFFSLVMPMILEGRVYVQPIDTHLDSFVLELQRLRLSNFTQLLYPLFYGMLFLSTIAVIGDRRTLVRTYRLSVLSGIVVLSSGFAYLCLVRLGGSAILKKWYWFATGSEIVPVHFLFGFPRMFTVAGEPGYTGMYLLFVLGLSLAAVLTKQQELLSQGLAKLIVILTLAGIFLTFSVTPLLGVIILLSVIYLLLLHSTYAVPFFRATAMLALLGLAGSVIVLLTYNHLEHLILYYMRVLVGKAGSGPIRLKIAMHGLQLFLQHPLLGIGYGSTRSVALSVYLLANVGLLGTVPFFMFNLAVWKKGLKVYRSPSKEYKSLALGMIGAFTSIFALMQFAKSESSLLFPYYWILLAMIVSVYDISFKEFGSRESTSRGLKGGQM